ncbi:hypothetical protein ACIGBL_31515 [Streptomyces sp. NPDC085614]|uniref:hypothetical protein n=1 Tax=Streptomyces sp. NPDC085614 TaxID=3365733 RepID=UPI0037D1F681
MLLVAAVLLCAPALVVAGRVSGLAVLAWVGVVMWVAGVLAVSHFAGHGPRPPWRR